jgi:hypothetical protein
MSSVIISNQASFGQLTNQSVAKLVSANTQMARLTEAVATASSGYEGTPGTEFETVSGAQVMPASMPQGTNLFQVQANPNAPGEQGQAYRYAIDNLKEHWATFWTAAQPYISAIDNGQGGY